MRRASSSCWLGEETERAEREEASRSQLRRNNILTVQNVGLAGVRYWMLAPSHPRSKHEYKSKQRCSVSEGGREGWDKYLHTGSFSPPAKQIKGP